ncbi:hypothetical protein CONCODRAFT_76667 [Conidiobolus coronatus NRRL 28638]|uniref:Zn(2)-C6 fungal-type domain-containing protein n=1 Tax=Conidiobolus coronatus (strain ATCC 28846 / CBS 209.66 / NRRL 28638) TaxID=796925 RepID=A0A137PIG4_CONC2|nr:hypothetical protein CONCODRAFT_76667 [Conidiobolus coronatus NRRL 28638]|eukprot:KXN74782.1 hypothetical protein CONCODRAFT_76667 [Conidiobolus coronatus NRRL 28638]
MLSCDECRIAKKKCDRNTPCSRCAEKKLSCQYTAKKYKHEVVPKRLKLELRLKRLEESLLNFIEDEHGVKVELPKFEQSVLPKYGFSSSNKESVSPLGSSSGPSSSSSAIPIIRTTINTDPKDQINFNIPLPYLETLLQTYIESVHLFYPFVNIEYVNYLFTTNPHASILLNVLYLVGEVTQNRLNNINPITLFESSYFYQVTRWLIKLKEDTVDLEIVQALFLLGKLELELGYSYLSNRHIIDGVKKLQMMNKDQENQDWKNTWAIACKIDTVTEVSSNMPSLIKLKSQHFLESQSSLYTSDDPSQLLNICIMWAYLMQQLHHLRKQVDAKTINVNDFLESFHDISQYLKSHPFYKIEAVQFLQSFRNHTYFSGYLSNFIIYNLRIINFRQTVRIFMDDNDISEEIKNSPMLELSRPSIVNLCTILCSGDSELQQAIDKYIKLDYSFILAYYTLYVAADDTISAICKKKFDESIEYWPSLTMIQKYQRPCNSRT